MVQKTIFSPKRKSILYPVESFSELPLTNSIWRTYAVLTDGRCHKVLMMLNSEGKGGGDSDVRDWGSSGDAMVPSVVDMMEEAVVAPISEGWHECWQCRFQLQQQH